MYYPDSVPSSPSSVNATASSSPVFGPADSSPPSSPGLAPYSLDSPLRPQFTHPFAASTKAIKLPHYEKLRASPPCTPPCVFTPRSVGLCRGAVGARSLQEDDFLSSASPDASPGSRRISMCVDDDCVWDHAIQRAIDTGNGQIDLSNQGLKSISPSIADLAGFFNTPEVSEQRLFSARPWVRVNTEPSRTRSFGRTQSIQDSGKERHVLKLYLMGNAITSLPRALFTVQNLTVLSLRKNGLTFIPPEISLLTHLHELNVSNNKLTFLPWQMRDMRIARLMVNPNPFLPAPPARPHDPLGRRVGPTTHALGRVPPLTELCLRLLLAPSPSPSSDQTVLAEYYGLPLPDAWTARVPAELRALLCDAVPGALRPPKRCARAPEDADGEDASARVGRCPNPAHAGRVFVQHGSERYSWERRVAGVDVGGAVPLRWRGCLPDCLDFLDVPLTAPMVPMSADDESDSDSDADEVPAIDLGQAELDMDDFD